jgi:hypothetical protein
VKREIRTQALPAEGFQNTAFSLADGTFVVPYMDGEFRWNDWNVDHIGDHGVSPEEAEYVVDSARPPYPQSVGGGKWLVRGQGPDGRYLQVIFVIEDDCYYVVHARGLNDKEKRQHRRRLR